MTPGLEAYRRGVDSAMADLARQVNGDDDVARAVRYALEGGGKRLRPVLCLAAMDAVRGARGQRQAGAPAAAACRAAAAIELVHTYSLVHDDLPCMDDDALRRGRPTVHLVFDSRTAMLAGFALIPLACRTLDRAAADLGIDLPTRRRAVRTLCGGAGASGMVGGQMLDLEAEGRPAAMQQLRRIHAMKTGALFTAAVRVGGMLAGASEEMLDALGAYGARLGLAFQITDDVLDVTMGATQLGKTPGKDNDALKVTFVSLLGVDAARAAAGAESDAALACLADADVASAGLTALARLAVDRDR